MGFQIHPTARGTNYEIVSASDPEFIIFNEPITIRPEDNEWFWREKTIFMKISRGEKQVCSTTINVSTSRKIISCGQRTHGVVFDETGFYSHSGFLSFNKMKQIKYEQDFVEFVGEECQIEGSYVHAFDGSTHNYYHWLIECVPALFALREAGITDPALFLRKEHVTSWHKEYFGLMNETSCLYLNSMDRESISVEKLHWAESRYLDALPPSRLMGISSYFRSKVGVSPLRRIYIKRNSSIIRSVENAAEIENFLTSIGFVIVDLGSHTVQTQIALFSGANIVVGTHGAGLANLIFMPKKSILLEILPDGHEVRNLFWMLANKVDVAYAFIRAGVHDPNNSYMSTMRVPVDDLKSMIGLIERNFV